MPETTANILLKKRFIEQLKKTRAINDGLEIYRPPQNSRSRVVKISDNTGKNEEFYKCEKSENSVSDSNSNSTLGYCKQYIEYIDCSKIDGIPKGYNLVIGNCKFGGCNHYGTDGQTTQVKINLKITRNDSLAVNTATVCVKR